MATEPKIEHEFIDLSDVHRPDEDERPLRLGTYDIVKTEMLVLEDRIIFRHRISLKYGPPPKVVPVNPAGEDNSSG